MTTVQRICCLCWGQCGICPYFISYLSSIYLSIFSSFQVSSSPKHMYPSWVPSSSTAYTCTPGQLLQTTPSVTFIYFIFQTKTLLEVKGDTLNNFPGKTSINGNIWSPQLQTFFIILCHRYPGIYLGV